MSKAERKLDDLENKVEERTPSGVEDKKEAEFLKILDEDPEVRNAYKQVYRAEKNNEERPPEAVETLREAERRAENEVRE